MALFEFDKNQEVENISAVPANLQVFYEPSADGTKHVLRGDDVTKGAIAIITGQGKALTAARAEAAGLKGKAVDLSALGKYGTTVEEISTAFEKTVADLTAKVNAKSKDNGVDIEAVKRDMLAGFEKEKTTYEARVTGLTSQLHELLVTNAIRSAVGKAGDADLIAPFAREHIRVVENEGVLSAVVVGEDGKTPRYNGVGQPFSIGELITEMKGADKYKRLFDSQAVSGGGVTPAPGKGVARQTTTGSDSRSSVSKIADGLRKKPLQRGV